MLKILKFLFGTTQYSNVEHLEPLIKYIKEHFSDTYEFIDNAYEVILKKN